MKDLPHEVWMPHFWFFLYTVAHSYPEFPNKLTKRKYYDFIINIPLFLPHSEQRTNFIRLLDEFPVTPYLDNPESFTYWVHFMNNRSNNQLGKEEHSYLEHLDQYYKEYEPKPFVVSRRYGIQKQYLIFIFILICIGAIGMVKYV